MSKLLAFFVPSLLALLLAATQGPIIPGAVCSGCNAKTAYSAPTFTLDILGDGWDPAVHVTRDLRINGDCAEPMPGLPCMPVNACIALITVSVQQFDSIALIVSAGVNECGVTVEDSVDFDGGAFAAGWVGPSEVWVQAKCTGCSGAN